MVSDTIEGTFGRYTVEGPLGQGGMGRVMLAKDTVLGRMVALKFLRPDLGLPPETRSALFDRMRHEARAVAALSDPHIVTLYDMGDSETLGLYLVFECIDGPSLRERLSSGPLPPSEVAALARGIGAALSYAHAAGVVHRDIKPENILLSRTGAKLTDFGIARLPDSTLTQAGTVLGTPAYSAPESLASGHFSPQSDQFAFALTLYEALSGQRAFSGPDAQTTAAKVATEWPEPLAQRSPFGKAMGRMDAVLARAMSKDPKLRYASCKEFGEAAAMALEASPTPAFLSDFPSRGSLFALARESILPRATRRLHNIAAAIALLVLVGLATFGRRPPPGVSLRKVATAFEATALVPPKGVLPKGKSGGGAKSGMGSNLGEKNTPEGDLGRPLSDVAGDNDDTSSMGTPSTPPDGLGGGLGGSRSEDPGLPPARSTASPLPSGRSDKRGPSLPLDTE